MRQVSADFGKASADLRVWAVAVLSAAVAASVVVAALAVPVASAAELVSAVKVALQADFASALTVGSGLTMMLVWIVSEPLM